MSRRFTTEEWISQAREMHGNIYDYSKVNYTVGKNKVIIGCSQHGFFEQQASSHKRGCGCPDCFQEARARGDKKRLGLDKFIEKARAVHGDDYDYSRVVYVKAKSRVIIGCKNCGKWFEQSPDKHSNAGRGCWDCGAKKAGETQRLTTSEFVFRAKEIHGDYCDYSKTKYISQNHDVEIWCNRCKQHFSTNPNKHLMGRIGCHDCRYERTGEAQIKSTEEWIEDAKKVHGDDYDYSEVNYTGNKEKVNIKCLTCDSFFDQEAKSHMLGSGCRYCAAMGFQRNKPAYYYVNEIININTQDRLFFKGGISSDWRRRLYQLKIHLPEHMEIINIETLFFERGEDALFLEGKLKSTYGIRIGKRNFPGGDELFDVNPLEYARNHGWID